MLNLKESLAKLPLGTSAHDVISLVIMLEVTRVKQLTLKHKGERYLDVVYLLYFFLSYLMIHFSIY